jgi:hypothetical protein
VLDPALLEERVESEHIVPRDAEDVANVSFVESLEEILAYRGMSGHEKHAFLARVSVQAVAGDRPRQNGTRPTTHIVFVGCVFTPD